MFPIWVLLAILMENEGADAWDARHSYGFWPFSRIRSALERVGRFLFCYPMIIVSKAVFFFVGRADIFAVCRLVSLLLFCFRRQKMKRGRSTDANAAASASETPGARLQSAG